MMVQEVEQVEVELVQLELVLQIVMLGQVEQENLL
jgi:hypothetical protein